MSAADWTKAGTGTDVETATGVLEGTYSLQMSSIGAGSGTGRQWARTVGADRTSMKIRTLVKPTAFTASSETKCFYLFGMMQGSIGLSSNAYFLSLYGANASNPFTEIRLIKGNDPLGASVVTAHSQTIALNQLVTLELKWQRDPTSGYVFLTPSIGANPDYSDLTPISGLTYTDAAGYSSALSAGFGVKGTIFGNITVLCDVNQGLRV